MQRVEGMEEPFLRLLLAYEELDVVEQEHIGAAVSMPELFGLALTNGADVVVGELFRRRVNQAHAHRKRLLPDGMKQVSLPESDLRVEHQRVIHIAGITRDRLRRGVRQLVGLAHDEAVEGVSSVQRRRTSSYRRFGCRR